MYKSMKEINRLDSLLKLCPFCGGKARISDAIRPDGTGEPNKMDFRTLFKIIAGLYCLWIYCREKDTFKRIEYLILLTIVVCC